MRYDSYRYLWPPRPEHIIPPGLLKYYETLHWICQIKKNGTCLVLFCRGPEVIVQTRHNSPPKTWALTPTLRSALSGRFNQWTVLVGELLHHKCPHIKNTIYLFDLLVDSGRHLVGTPLIDRLDRLHSLFPRQVDCLSVGAYQAADHLWIAKTYPTGFSKLFKGLTMPEDEGLVLKDPSSKLSLCARPGADSSGQVKCRR